MVIKKIFDDISDEEVHLAFLRFGRGQYKNKYLLQGKRQAKNWAIKTSAEYTNFLVRSCLEKITGQVAIKGIIVSTLDLKDEIEFEIKKVSNFQGVRRYIIDTETEPSKVLGLMNKYPKIFFALSFNGDGFVLKVKAKAPKSAKPGKDDEKPVADFCSLKTGDKTIIDELFFGVGDFQEASIRHDIDVTGIVYPANIENLKPTEIRELAKRKGVIKRNVEADGIEKTSEAEFVA
ncbi:MAG: hypothetical protein ABIF18_00255 [archaeon]